MLEEKTGATTLHKLPAPEGVNNELINNNNEQARWAVRIYFSSKAFFGMLIANFSVQSWGALGLLQIHYICPKMLWNCHKVLEQAAELGLSNILDPHPLSQSHLPSSMPSPEVRQTQVGPLWGKVFPFHTVAQQALQWSAGYSAGKPVCLFSTS